MRTEGFPARSGVCSEAEVGEWPPPVCGAPRQSWEAVQRGDARTRMPGSHPAASLTGCVIMGKSLNFSGPQFPPVQNGHDSGYLRPAVRMWRVKSLAQGLAHGRCVSALVFRLLLLLLPGEGLRGGGQALSSCVLACSGRVTGWAHGQGALPVLAVAVHVSSQGSAQIKGGLWR